ncbi:MAG: helix-turn-helix transcriptional regulator [Thalassolituus oleivorans]|nr:helix-turn-helix transcriptional regulator [Thalassolituus oleivorans]|tara:strand:- start:1274 stop:1612 length:339 start_codon:yes stop_codon:yes gene_type:complete
MTQSSKDYTTCPVEATLKLIQGKWKIVIMFRLRDEPLRFNELTRMLPDVTQKMLTNQLRELESDGLVHRDIFPEVPPKVIYSLTDLAHSLMPVMFSIKDWGRNYLDSSSSGC